MYRSSVPLQRHFYLPLWRTQPYSHSPETINVVRTRVPALACFSEAGCRLSTLHQHTNTSRVIDENNTLAPVRWRLNVCRYPLSATGRITAGASGLSSLWRSFPLSVQWRCFKPGGVLVLVLVLPLPVYWRLRLGVTSEEEEKLAWLFALCVNWQTTPPAVKMMPRLVFSCVSAVCCLIHFK